MFIPPFQIKSSPVSPSKWKIAISVTLQIKEGDTVYTKNQSRVILGKVLGRPGNEGTVYSTDNDSIVCKIYHNDKLVLARQEKLSLMTKQTISNPSICFPSDIVYDSSGVFRGCIMPRAQGKSVQDLFIQPNNANNHFGQWGATYNVCLALSILDKVKFLHSHNVLLSDYNPANFLVLAKDKVYLIDCDSYQVEDYPCPVQGPGGLFTAPEIQGKNFETILRTKDNELFAVATLLFHILIPGVYPYNTAGDPLTLLKASDFPFADGTFSKIQGGPNGPNYCLWKYLDNEIQQLFIRTFHGNSQNKRPTVEDWIDVLTNYKFSLKIGQQINKIRDECDKKIAEAEHQVWQANRNANDWENTADSKVKERNTAVFRMWSAIIAASVIVIVCIPFYFSAATARLTASQAEARADNRIAEIQKEVDQKVAAKETETQNRIDKIETMANQKVAAANKRTEGIETNAEKRIAAMEKERDNAKQIAEENARKKFEKQSQELADREKMLKQNEDKAASDRKLIDEQIRKNHAAAKAFTEEKITAEEKLATALKKSQEAETAAKQVEKEWRDKLEQANIEIPVYESFVHNKNIIKNGYWSWAGVTLEDSSEIPGRAKFLYWKDKSVMVLEDRNRNKFTVYTKSLTEEQQKFIELLFPTASNGLRQ